MKKTVVSLTLVAAMLLGLYITMTKAADPGTFQTYEYATIRWGGRENTHLIRPNGRVEVLGPLLSKIQRPDRADDRSFYLTIALNAVAKEGYEFVGMTGDEIVVRRQTAK
jgi:hypothetical protein